MRKESTPKILKLVGRRISEARRARELSQEALAAKLDVYVQWLSRCENGHENLTLGTAVRFANALGVRVVDLLSEQEADPELPKRVRAKKRRARS